MGVQKSFISNPAREAVSAIAMTVTLLSFAMLFLALFLGYAILRANAVAWPGLGVVSIDLFYPTLSSTVIIMGSVCYIRFQQVGSVHWLYGALAFGGSFLLSQWMLWENLAESGLYVDAGIFPSLVYGLTWIHGGHILLTLVLMGYLALRLGRFSDPQGRQLWVRNVGKFWHFLGVLWFFIYFGVFIF